MLLPSAGAALYPACWHAAEFSERIHRGQFLPLHLKAAQSRICLPGSILPLSAESSGLKTSFPEPGGCLHPWPRNSWGAESSRCHVPCSPQRQLVAGLLTTSVREAASPAPSSRFLPSLTLIKGRSYTRCGAVAPGCEEVAERQLVPTAPVSECIFFQNCPFLQCLPPLHPLPKELWSGDNEDFLYRPERRVDRGR